MTWFWVLIGASSAGFVLIWLGRSHSGWSNLRNWSGVAELALRLGGILAAVAAANFLAPRGDVGIAVVPQRTIDAAAVADVYAADGRDVPPIVTSSITTYPEAPAPPPVLYGDAFAREGQTLKDLLSDPTFDSSTWIAPYQLVPAKASAILDEVFGAPYTLTAPIAATAVAASGELAGDDLRYALKAIAGSISPHVRLRLSNRGDAEASVTSIEHPKGMMPVVPLALPILISPGESVAIDYDLAEARRSDVTGFVVHSDTPAIVPLGLLQALGAAFAVVVIGVFTAEVRRSTPQADVAPVTTDLPIPPRPGV